MQRTARAAEDARRVLAESKWQTRHKNAEELLKWAEQRKASGEGTIYAELLPANRLAVEHRWDEARAAYESVRARHADDPQVRFRIAQLEFNRGDDAKAEAEFSSIMNAGTKTPAWIRSNAMLHVARIQDLRGRRDEALRLYKRIVAEYEHESAAAGARAGLVAPYRRRSAPPSK
jgi:tetratricopeptide (TPR) repeat protein